MERKIKLVGLWRPSQLAAAVGGVSVWLGEADAATRLSGTAGGGNNDYYYQHHHHYRQGIIFISAALHAMLVHNQSASA